MKLICFSNFRVTSVHKVHPTRKDPFDHPPVVNCTTTR